MCYENYPEIHNPVSSSAGHMLLQDELDVTCLFLLSGADLQLFPHPTAPAILKLL